MRLLPFSSSYIHVTSGSYTSFWDDVGLIACKSAQALVCLFSGLTINRGEYVEWEIWAQ